MPESANRPHRCSKDFGKRSVCRNPLIANLLLRCDYIEKMGTGIGRIRAALEREHCPKVNIRFDTMFGLEFPRPTHAEDDRTSERTGKETRVRTREETREEILALITKNSRITIAQLAIAIGITPKGIEWQIGRLKKDGLLRRIGPTKGGHWEVVT